MIFHSRKKQQGLTLIEILITLGVIASVATLIGFFGLDILNLQLFLSDELKIQQELSLTLRVLSSDMRGMGTADHGGYPIGAASSSSFTFYSDPDGNGKFEQIRYFLDGTTFKRGIISSSGVPPSYPVASESLQDLVHDIVSPDIFEYFDNAYTGAQAPLPVPVDIPKVRLVRTSLTLDRDPLRPPSATTASINAAIRNLRTF